MPVPQGSGAHGKPMFGQAHHIIAKFGGPQKLSALLTEAGHPVSRIAIFRWRYRPPAGTNGLVPNHWRGPITKIARIQGVLLTDDDWDQRRIIYKQLEATE